MPEETLDQENQQQTLNENDIFNFLDDDNDDNDDNEPVENKEEKEEEEDDSDKSSNDESDESDEDSEDESEDEESDDESEEDIEDLEDDFHTVPKKKEILAKYPDLFKTFPGLEKSIYREQQYAELFPSLDSAKEAKERLEGFHEMESQLLDGNINNLFKVVKKVSEGSFNKITDNLLKHLYEADENAYHAVTEGVVRTLLSNAFNKGKQTKDEQLEIASQVLSDRIFGEQEPKPFKRQPEENKANQELERIRNERLEFAKQQLTIAVNDVNQRAQNIVKNNIDKNIDPKNQMNRYVRNKAIEDVIVELDKEIRTDKRFQEILDKHWKKAAEEGYSESAKVRIRNVYLAKAKTVLPGLVKKVRADILKDMRVPAPKKKAASQERTERKIASKPKSDDAPRKAMSTLDFLNQD